MTLSLCRHLRDSYGIVVVTNDIFTKEDGEFLTKHEALTPTDRIRAVETGGCPHGGATCAAAMSTPASRSGMLLLMPLVMMQSFCDCCCCHCCCCHLSAIREDCSANLQMVENLTREYKPDFCLLEAGGGQLRSFALLRQRGTHMFCISRWGLPRCCDNMCRQPIRKFLTRAGRLYHLRQKHTRGTPRNHVAAEY